MAGIAEFLGDLREPRGAGAGQRHGRDDDAARAQRRARHCAGHLARQASPWPGAAPSSTASTTRSSSWSRAGEQLPFGPDRFDVVVGKAVLHHLDVARAAPELHRVLRPGGRAAFAEPLGTNPVIAFARDHIPYPGRTLAARTSR